MNSTGLDKLTLLKETPEEIGKPTHFRLQCWTTSRFCRLEQTIHFILEQTQCIALGYLVELLRIGWSALVAAYLEKKQKNNN